MRKALITATTLTLFILLLAAPAHTQTGALTGHKICLDPGHGGSDPGAVNESYGLLEKDINLDVSYGLRALLEGEGAQVDMTRSDDADRDNRDRYTFCNNEGADILVSVHTNGSTDPSTDGSMALYFHRDDEALAQAIYDVMYPYLRASAPDPNTFTDFGLDKYASGVLLKSDMPSAMMEPVFMSNGGEAEGLVTPIYVDGGTTVNPACQDFTCRRGQIARAICDGILDYFGAAADAPPSVSVTHPDDGATISGLVTVTANANDDVRVSEVAFSVDGESIGVDGDGSDGWSAAWITTDYGEGSHTVTAAATDSGGQTASDSVSVVVDNVNDPPGASFTATCSGLSCDFDGSDSSDPDGSIGGYDWDFGDGSTASGVTVSHSFASAGTYSVTLTVTDDAGASDVDTQSITVSEAVGTMHVADLDGASINQGRTWNAVVTVIVYDANDSAVSGADVAGVWSGGGSGLASCSTDADGQCQVHLRDIHKRNASVTFAVEGVTHDSLSYDSTANRDPEGDSDGTTITVAKP